MPNYSFLNIATGNPDGTVTFTPSGSAYAPTSSNASVAAQVDIIVSSHPTTTIISNSGSHLGGINNDLLIRFYSQSHIEPKYLSSIDPLNVGGYFRSSTKNLYVTQSINENFTFRDIAYTTNDSGSALRDKIFNAITGSSSYRNGAISASVNSNTSGGFNYFSCSIHYNGSKGEIHSPVRYTGSFSTLSSSLFINTPNPGEGPFLNFAESLIMPRLSSSLTIGFDYKDPTSIQFTTETSSLGYIESGRTNPNLFYFSSSGNLGIKTNNPTVEFDVIASETQFQSPGSRKGLKINSEGNIESFDRTAASATTGSEFILKYSRGVTINANNVATMTGVEIARRCFRTN